MARKTIILTFVIIAALLLNHQALNILSLPSSINNELLVEFTINIVEDFHEEENLSNENDKNNNLVSKQKLAGSPDHGTILGILPPIWQPPES